MPLEVLVSRTIVDLVPGSGLQVDDRGMLRPGSADRSIQVMALRQAP